MLSFACADTFIAIPFGPIKADYFRAHILLDGGVYADIDLSPLIGVESLISSTTDNIFIPYGHRSPELNPTFIITPPNHPFILATVRAYAT